MRHFFPIALLSLIAATTNPADLYRSAFDKIDDRIKGKRSELNDVDQTPLNEKTAAYLREREPVIRLLTEAAKLPTAHWPMPIGDGDMAKVLPQLNKARTASAMLLLRARMDLHEKKPADAVEHSLAAMAMARHIGQQKLLVSRMIEIGMEVQAIEQMQAMLPSLPSDVAKALPAKLAALPKAATFADTVRAEFAFGQAAMKQQDVAPEFIEAAKPFFDAVAAATTQPAEQFDATVDLEAQKLFLNPFVSNTASTFKRSMTAQRLIDKQRQALLDEAKARAASAAK